MVGKRSKFQAVYTKLRKVESEGVGDRDTGFDLSPM